MKTYVTLGQEHRHVINDVVIDKDCVVAIEAKSKDEGRAMAFRIFGDKFCTTYAEKPEMKWYPRGIIHINVIVEPESENR